MNVSTPFFLYLFPNLPPIPTCSIMKAVTTMHEFAITESILNIALDKAREAQAQKITRINLVIGDLAGVVAESVEFCFSAISRGTAAEGAGLSFEKKPAGVRCHHCNTVFTPKDGDWACPECRQVGIEIVSGRECYMESIEVE